MEQNPVKVGEERTFTTPYEQYRDREGQTVTVTRIINTPDADHDEKVLPMYGVRFPDGFETEAWPEEIGEGDCEPWAT